MLTLGSITVFGKLIAIEWVGERYYWFIKNDVISMIPASYFDTVSKGEK